MGFSTWGTVMASGHEVAGSNATVMLKRAIRNSPRRHQTSPCGSSHEAHTSIENIHTAASRGAGSTIPRNFNNRLWITVLLPAVSFSAVTCFGFRQPVSRGLLVLEVVLYGERSAMG